MKYFMPQYAARAVLDLEETIKAIKAQEKLRFYASAVANVALMIRSAVHVVLPANGEVYRDTGDFGGVMPSADECESFAGLPAPLTCFQYPWTHRGVNRDGASIAPKRITLVYDGKQSADLDAQVAVAISGRAVASNYEKPEGTRYSATFLSVAFDEIYRRWALQPLAVSIAEPLTCAPSGLNRGPWDWGWEGTARDLMSGQVLTKETGQTTEAQQTYLGQYRPDVTAVVQCCHALRAGARLEENTEQSASRRKKFERLGVGGFTYHVLKLPGHVTSGRPASTGSHASPRLHVRRAHIRKLPTGVLTFVRQCFVGDADRGVVAKDYRVAG